MKTEDTLYNRMQLEISSLAASVQEILASFRQLREPIVESQETVPNATEQIDRISQQTEAAANRMLDRVEGISQREDEVMRGLQDLKERLVEGETDRAVAIVDELHARARENSNDAFTIIEALQFQDITAQQMDHAAAMLEDLGARLSGMLSLFPDGLVRESEFAAAGVQSRERVFDPHADMSDKRTLQADIDDMFARNRTE